MRFGWQTPTHRHRLPLELALRPPVSAEAYIPKFIRTLRVPER
jgi:hypothetical protein